MKRILLITTIIMAAISCNNINPFLTEWDTPYGIPDFTQIQEKHYIPAIEMGIRQQQGEIDAIIANADAPTFENVVEAYERSGAILDRVSMVLFNVSESDATESLQKIVEQALPLISEHSDNIFMNPYFFAKVDALYKDIDNLGLNQEQKMTLKNLHNAFVKNGVALDEASQARMREINMELSSLSNTFGNNLLAENNAFAEEFGVSISEYGEAMAATEDRALREKMFKAYSSRGNNGNEYDNKDLMVRMMALRIEKANLLGYDNPAQMILADKMAGNPETVDSFLASIMAPAVAKAKEEIADMQVFMDEDIKAGLLPEGSVIEPWDWAYYTEKVRKAKYALDEEQTKPYFQMENVRQGVFDLTTKLWGLQYEKLENIPVYHEDVEGFKVTDADGSLIGVILTDYFPRSTKRGGAWMTNFVNQEVIGGEDIRPVIVNVGNFAKPAADKPSLLSLDNVETLFHEFGHALHGLLSQCTYKSVSGTSVARDFVELPSQIMENWAFQKEVLADYARHYETGEVIPDSLVAKIEAAANFNQGFMTTELAAASILDMKWHELTSAEGLDPMAFEKAACEEMGLIDEIIPRYRSTYFAHIFSGGYSAGYYSYLWAEVLDKDAFELFMQKGIFDKETAMSFRRNVLEKGGSDEPMDLYRRFRGADPDAGALLRGRGL
ncbi:MAG: M3 family metallopeptidase [Bacteroidales bacterium]|nr:M3 family metallopeptidase [Bacteroidales bacterium]MBQ8573956.1 M3 family metallopeptidase [Bacteroidales bacterium]MBR1959254.1 M3 family metallopeptidase [Bacteroidales bacterium]